MSDSASPELQTAIAEAVASALLDVRVAGPGIVQSYDAAKQTCTVQPATRRPIQTEDGAVVHEDDAPVQNVPVAFWGTSNLTLHSTLAKGDTVLLVYLDFSPAGWRGRGAPADAGDTRNHGPSYPVALPWFRPSGGPGPDTDTASIGKPGAVRIKFGAGAISVGNGGDFVAMAAKVQAALDAIKTHTHPVATTGTAAAQTGTAAASPSLGSMVTDTASTNLKAD